MLKALILLNNNSNELTIKKNLIKLIALIKKKN